MEPFQKDSGKSKGIEVLYFEDAEIQKTKGDEISFAGFGGLSVLYFKDLNRFVLQLNDWRYPLLRRLTISSSSVKDDLSSRTYVLPAPNGFSFNLNISKVANSQAFDNLETILNNSSRFSVIGQEIPFRTLEASPEIKARRMLQTNPKEVIGETLKKVIEKVENTAATLKTGTKNLTSKKKKMDLNSIKTKNFRKEAKSRIKKDFIESSEKLSKEFLEKRRDNPNSRERKTFEELKKTSDSQAPALYIYKEELEAAILENRSIFNYLNQPEKTEEKVEEKEKKGLVTNLREGARKIGDRVRHMVDRRNLPNLGVQGQSETMHVPEGTTHYQG